MIILDTTEPAFVVIVKGRKKFGTRLSDDFGTTTIASVGIFGYVKAYLHGTTLSHATSLRQAYDMT